MKQGPFGLQLVDAETERVFQEHHSSNDDTSHNTNNEVYAEVEPDREYYIQLNSDGGMRPNGMVYVDVQVDGDWIEQRRPLSLQSSTHKMGVWKEQDGNFLESALKFDRAQIFDMDSRNGNTPDYWTGVVRAKFYGDPIYMTTLSPQPVRNSSAEKSYFSTISDSKRINSLPNSTAQSLQQKQQLKPSATATGTTKVKLSTPAQPVIYRKPKNFINTQIALGTSEQVGFVHGSTPQKQEKGVKTVRGTTVLSSQPIPVKIRRKMKTPPPVPSSTTRKPKKQLPSSSSSSPPPSSSSIAEEKEEDYPLLATITLHYCSAVGLIHAGILPKPKDFDLQQSRYKHGPRTDNWQELSARKVRKTKIDEVVDGRVVASKEYDTFDLTTEEI